MNLRALAIKSKTEMFAHDTSLERRILISLPLRRVQKIEVREVSFIRIFFCITFKHFQQMIFFFQKLN